MKVTTNYMRNLIAVKGSPIKFAPLCVAAGVNAGALRMRILRGGQMYADEGRKIERALEICYPEGVPEAIGIVSLNSVGGWLDTCALTIGTNHRNGRPDMESAQPLAGAGAEWIGSLSHEDFETVKKYADWKEEEDSK